MSTLDISTTRDTKDRITLYNVFQAIIVIIIIGLTVALFFGIYNFAKISGSQQVQEKSYAENFSTELSLIERERVASPNEVTRARTIKLGESLSGRTATVKIPSLFFDEELPTYKELESTITYN